MAKSGHANGRFILFVQLRIMRLHNGDHRIPRNVVTKSESVSTMLSVLKSREILEYGSERVRSFGSFPESLRKFRSHRHHAMLGKFSRCDHGRGVLGRICAVLHPASPGGKCCGSNHAGSYPCQEQRYSSHLYWQNLRKLTPRGCAKLPGAHASQHQKSDGAASQRGDVRCPLPF